MKIKLDRTPVPQSRLFSIGKYWSGKLIYITVFGRWWLIIDMRKDVIGDLKGENNK